MGRASQPRDRRGRWTEAGAGARLGSQKHDFARALQAESASSTRDNSGRSTVYAYLRDKDSPNGKAGSPYYVGVAGDVTRPYGSHGRTPVPSDERRIRMLRQNVTHEQAREWEKHYIQQFGRRDIGTGRKMLINHTDGGEGVTGHRHSKATRAKLSAAHKGRKLPAEQVAKMAASRRGKTQAPEAREKIANAARNISAETRARRSAALKGRAHTQEARAKMSASHSGKTLTPEHRAKISAANQAREVTAEARAKMSAATKGKTQDSAHVAARAAAKTRTAAMRNGVDPVVYAKMSKNLRSNAHREARRLGITYAQYVEKMRPKWGI